SPRRLVSAPGPLGPGEYPPRGHPNGPAAARERGFAVITPRFRAVGPSRRARAGSLARVLILRCVKNRWRFRYKDAYLAGQKTASAQAATKQFSRTNPIAMS